ncbi:inositol polyphosphate 5-phosphatase K-like [Megalops cyprinoides]|uniref:inositol polyphosphate 5-phosphatase K-like n=1 Tax=Megalops cyprinoides TaxID=118141 RepID=UPI001863C448|nr:inositol polyphosphate 5-phosphatase K-like [Megalops cyprinoides]
MTAVLENPSGWSLEGHADSVPACGPRSAAKHLALRSRLIQLLGCVEDLGPDSRVREAVSHTLDKVFLLRGQRSGYDRREQFRLHVVTWNVGKEDPPSDISSLLQLNSHRAADLYVIGLQEVNSTPLRLIKDLALEDPWSHTLMATLSTHGYVKMSSIRMQGLLLLVFSHQAHVPFIRDIQATFTRTGIFGYWGNKGGVSVRLSFYGHTLCFLNCHLAAHMKNAIQRVDEFEYILDSQSFSVDNTPRVLDHEVVFWFGDLNFCIVDHSVNSLCSAINKNHYSQLWEKDQLMIMKKEEVFLQEFQEGPLQFKPTYKFDLFSENYDTSDKSRKPAWTDRILWRVKPKASTQKDEKSKEFGQEGNQKEYVKNEEEFNVVVKQDTYTSNMEYGISEHKPVISTFSLELKKKYEVPLVQVGAEGEWSADFDAMATYSTLQPFPFSTWDWIGLYKVGFRNASDYITYTWVKNDENSFSNEVTQVYMSKEEIPVHGGECVLCYYSRNMQCIVGISSPFKVHESKAAIEEGLVPENISCLDKVTAS